MNEFNLAGYRPEPNSPANTKHWSFGELLRPKLAVRLTAHLKLVIYVAMLLQGTISSLATL